jgi:hypothetical protein
VDVVRANGTVAPYNVHFFDADADDTSTTLRVLAPAGVYGGLTFSWGLTQACNARVAEASNAPLSPTSQMSWPHTGGFLFFRYEGRTVFPGTAGAGGAAAGGAGAGGAGAGGAGAGA